MSKKKIVIISIAVIGVIFLSLVIGAFCWYQVGKSPVEKEAGRVIRVEIEEGSGVVAIADLLEEKNVIRSASVMKIYLKLKGTTNALQAGKYDFDNSQDLSTILSHIQKGEVVREEVKLTFIEGKNMRNIAKTIAAKTVHTEEDVFHLLEDEEYIDSLIDKYWFLTEDIKKDGIYYPLEGYLLPDTYIFENEEVSVKTIFNVMLNYMKNFLNEYQDSLEYPVHELITLASIAEIGRASCRERVS